MKTEWVFVGQHGEIVGDHDKSHSSGVVGLDLVMLCWDDIRMG